MNYIEIKKDLFTFYGECYFVHCIAEDLRMGAGIAVHMQKIFKLRDKILNSGCSVKYPTCILTDKVFNLITKRYSSGKPTYDTLKTSLLKMKEIIIKNDIRKIAMPKIGCGLDKLQWEEVKKMIHDIFSDVEDLEIIVCFL